MYLFSIASAPGPGFVAKDSASPIHLIHDNTNYISKTHICADELIEINKYNMWVSSILYEALIRRPTLKDKPSAHHITLDILKQHMIHHPNMQTPSFCIENNEEFYKTLEYSYSITKMNDKNDKIFVNQIVDSSSMDEGSAAPPGGSGSAAASGRAATAATGRAASSAAATAATHAATDAATATPAPSGPLAAAATAAATAATAATAAASATPPAASASKTNEYEIGNIILYTMYFTGVYSDTDMANIKYYNRAENKGDKIFYLMNGSQQKLGGGGGGTDTAMRILNGGKIGRAHV